MNSLFNKYMERQIEKHLPTAFIDFGLLVKIVDVLSKNKKFERREILILSYVIGLNAEEGNVLLTLAGEQPLYVKHREDAVWRYALNNHKDCNSIIREIFPENADENHKSNVYNKVTVKRKEGFSMTCPECGSTDVSKVGHYCTGGYNGSDEYECNDCGNEFTVSCE